MGHLKELFQKIYDSEINCRIEWCWDGGFTWCISDQSKLPRIWIDNDLSECLKKTIRSKYYSKKMKNPVYEKDWLARGCEYSLEDAILKMTDAIIEHFPNSKFTQWIKDFNINREHFFYCAKCGDLVDMRDLKDVFEHEDKKDIPKANKSNYISKKEGDNKAWHKGKRIDLN